MYTALTMPFTPHFKHIFTLQSLLPYPTNLFWYITKSIFYFTLTLFWADYHYPQHTKYNSHLQFLSTITYTPNHYKSYIHFSISIYIHIINPSRSIFCPHFLQYIQLLKCSQAAANLLQHQSAVQVTNSHPSA